MTQAEMILNHLKRGRRITPLEALQKYGCLRLSARIHDLRKMGHDIASWNRPVDTRNGEKHVSEYWLVKK